MKNILPVTKLRCYAALLFCVALTGLKAQELGKIAHVSLKQGSPSDSLSFILAPVDYNAFRNEFVKCASSLQIVDANTPWPPRWYFSYRAESRPKGEFNNVIIDASSQNEQISFFTFIISKTADGKTNY